MMQFDELDKKMRVYEQSLDQVIVPEMYMVARLDGRGFTRLSEKTQPKNLNQRKVSVEMGSAVGWYNY